MEAFWVYIILKMLYVAGCTIRLSGTREARPSSLVRIRPMRDLYVFFAPARGPQWFLPFSAEFASCWLLISALLKIGSVSPYSSAVLCVFSSAFGTWVGDGEIRTHDLVDLHALRARLRSHQSGLLRRCYYATTP